MKRTLTTLAVALLLVFVAQEARGDIFGAYAQGHAGYQQTNRTGRPAYGAAAGLVLFGFEAFADLRFLGEGVETGYGMWNQLGLRFGIGIPALPIDIEPYVGLSYVYSKIYEDDVDPTDLEDDIVYKGFNPHAGLRIDVPLGTPFVSLGGQFEGGYHFLFPNGQEYSTGMNFAALANLKLSI